MVVQWNRRVALSWFENTAEKFNFLGAGHSFIMEVDSWRGDFLLEAEGPMLWPARTLCTASGMA
jgi:hypothetical protein